MSSPSILDTAEYRKLALIAAGVNQSSIPPILDTATWRHLMLAALYQIGSGGGGGGGGYINGIVNTYNDLPVTIGTPAINSVYLVRFSTGVWLINRHPAGLYIRISNLGNLDDWEYLGTFPEVQSDLRWRLYSETNPTKELKFDLQNISPSTTRTLTAPNASGVIVLSDDARIVNILKSGTTAGAYSGGAGGTIDLSGGNAHATYGVGGAAGTINLSGGDALDDYGDGHAGTPAGSIDLSGGAGGAGGSITMRGSQELDGSNTSGGAGSINLSGGSADGGNGGSINLIGNFGAAGSINLSGGAQSGGNGGSITSIGANADTGGSLNMSAVAGSGSGGNITTQAGLAGSGGSINTGNLGGNISTNGYWNSDENYSWAGGTINTQGGEGGEGGSINTSNGGGFIDTTGTGAIQLGSNGTRSIIVGTATSNRLFDLPDVTGKIATTAQPDDYEVTDYTKGIILKSPNDTRWRITINNDGTLSRVALALMTLLAFVTSGFAQVKDMVTDTNGTIITGRTNVLTFTNRVTIPIDSGAATTNSILTADGAGSSSFVASRTQTVTMTNSAFRTNTTDATTSVNGQTNMVLSVDANSTYWFAYAFILTTPTTGGFNARLNTTPSNNVFISQFIGRQGRPISVATTDLTASSTTVLLQSVNYANTNFMISGNGVLRTGTNTGTITLVWYQSTATNVATELQAGSTMTLIRIAP